jgi:hypothetical protein
MPSINFFTLDLECFKAMGLHTMLKLERHIAPNEDALAVFLET